MASDMTWIEYWCLLHKMVINIKKTKTMLITTDQKLQKLLVKEINISINNHTLDCITSEKLFGVVVD